MNSCAYTDPDFSQLGLGREVESSLDASLAHFGSPTERDVRVIAADVRFIVFASLCTDICRAAPIICCKVSIACLPRAGLAGVARIGIPVAVTAADIPAIVPGRLGACQQALAVGVTRRWARLPPSALCETRAATAIAALAVVVA